MSDKFRQFKKGYLPGWTEEVFIVSRVIPGVVVTYKIKEMDDTPLEGNFYTQDLQKVSVSDDDLNRVEKVLKRKGNKLLVRWKGWPDKYDSWIDKKDVQKTMAREGFYVQVLSSSNESEFPDNGPNYFKNRLPYPLRLPERGWQVGLSSISLPDATLNLTKLSALTAPLLRARWLNVGHPEQKNTNLTFADIKTMITL